MGVKTHHCEECTYHRAVLGNELACAYDHKPRWFSPKGPLDQNYGWKRKCEDFRELKKPDDRVEGRDAALWRPVD